jgi:hypothetical protein
LRVNTANAVVFPKNTAVTVIPNSASSMPVTHAGKLAPRRITAPLTNTATT